MTAQMHPNIKAVHDMFVLEFPVGPDGKTPHYPAWFCSAMNLFGREANRDCECCWQPPYGWVVEDGCPYHD